LPGRRSMILYWPSPSVTTLRVFSINAGLDASTVTPGSTAPDASLTMPAMEVGVCWAHDTDAASTHTAKVLTRATRRMQLVSGKDVRCAQDIAAGRSILIQSSS